MDAEKFFKELNRMCSSYEPTCGVNGGCPIDGVRNHPVCDSWIKQNAARAVEIVEQWSRKNPEKTKGQKFKEVFGLYPTAQILCDLNWWHEPYKAPKETN